MERERQGENAKRVIDTKLQKMQRENGSDFEEILGVKVKQEMLEENLSEKQVENTEYNQEQEKNGTNLSEVLVVDDEIHDTTAEIRRSGYAERGNNLVRLISSGKSKRRLQGLNVPKRKKYYQDIRSFATTTFNDKVQLSKLQENIDKKNLKITEVSTDPNVTASEKDDSTATHTAESHDGDYLLSTSETQEKRMVRQMESTQKSGNTETVDTKDCTKQNEHDKSKNTRINSAEHNLQLEEEAMNALQEGTKELSMDGEAEKKQQSNTMEDNLCASPTTEGSVNSNSTCPGTPDSVKEMLASMDYETNDDSCDDSSLNTTPSNTSTISSSSKEKKKKQAEEECATPPKSVINEEMEIDEVSENLDVTKDINANDTSSIEEGEVAETVLSPSVKKKSVSFAESSTSDRLGGYIEQSIDQTAPNETINTEMSDNTQYKPNYAPVFKLFAKAKANIPQTLRQRGYKMVEDKRVWETPLKLEFNLEKYITQYNVRENVCDIIDLMKKVDTSLKVKSSTTDKAEWVTTDSLPEDESFNEHFQIKELTFRKHRKVVVHFTATS